MEDKELKKLAKEIFEKIKKNKLRKFVHKEEIFDGYYAGGFK